MQPHSRHDIVYRTRAPCQHQILIFQPMLQQTTMKPPVYFQNRREVLPLLCLAVQRPCADLREPGKNINDDMPPSFRKDILYT